VCMRAVTADSARRCVRERGRRARAASGLSPHEGNARAARLAPKIDTRHREVLKRATMMYAAQVRQSKTHPKMIFSVSKVSAFRHQENGVVNSSTVPTKRPKMIATATEKFLSTRLNLRGTPGKGTGA